MLDAVDLSNWSGPLTPAQAEGLKAAGVKLVLIQAVDPPPGFPAGCTRQQIQTCLDAGLVVDSYIWIWFDLDISDIQRKLALLDGLPIRRLFLDVEDEAAKRYDQIVCEAKVRAALEFCDTFPTTSGERTGVYSGKWYWAEPAYMSDSTAFSDRDLWDANYDGIADANVGFVPYGGWDHCTIKQFQGTSTLAGVPNVDLNALADSELAKITNGGAAPPVADCQNYKDAIERAVNRLQIELDRKTAAGRAATLRRPLIAEIESELFQALSPPAA